MNILIYQPRVSYYVGGGEVVPLQHAKFLNQLGHSITILTTKVSDEEYSKYFYDFTKNNKDIKIIELERSKELQLIHKTLPGINWERWDLESIYFAKLATHHLINIDYDLIAYHNVLDSISLPSRKKAVVHLHGYPKELDYGKKLAMFGVNNYISVSSYIKTQWQQLYDFTNVTHKVVKNGIDHKYFLPTKAEKINDILFVGRLIHIKGVETLIKAIYLVKKYKSDIKVKIGGTGPIENFLKKLVYSLELQNNIDFIGYIPDNDLVNIYNNSKITVLPSYEREGILTTMLESSSCGTPVITTTACSMKEFITNNKNGILVPPEDEKILAERILMLLNTPDLLKNLSNSCRKSVLRDWSWEKKYKKYLKYMKPYKYSLSINSLGFSVLIQTNIKSYYEKIINSDFIKKYIPSSSIEIIDLKPNIYKILINKTPKNSIITKKILVLFMLKKVTLILKI